MGRLRVAVAADPPAAPEGVQGERDARGVEPRRSGAKVVLIASAIALMTSCRTAGGDGSGFRPYAACHEQPGSAQHDVGTVVWERDGDDGKRHYGFWPDRLRRDPRTVLDVTSVNRLCPLVNPSGISASERSPLGLMEGRQ